VTPAPAPKVIVVGAGPVGLTLANLLGAYSVPMLVVEERDRLIDYPRGVGIDDEALRTFQAAGLVDSVLPHAQVRWGHRMDGLDASADNVSVTLTPLITARSGTLRR
jgi:2-polyprenyl-6-methoxyphenol hydroxylase-like FAD-dependent oxidoreductase